MNSAKRILELHNMFVCLRLNAIQNFHIKLTLVAGTITVPATYLCYICSMQGTRVNIGIPAEDFEAGKLVFIGIKCCKLF